MPSLNNGKGLVVDVDRIANHFHDRAAAVVAKALGAEVLIFLTNVPGLLKDVHDPGSRVDFLDLAEIPNAIGLAQGSMKKKLLAAKEALEAGVERAVIADSRREAPVGNALAGDGTVITGGVATSRTSDRVARTAEMVEALS